MKRLFVIFLAILICMAQFPVCAADEIVLPVALCCGEDAYSLELVYAVSSGAGNVSVELAVDHCLYDWNYLPQEGKLYIAVASAAVLPKDRTIVNSHAGAGAGLTLESISINGNEVENAYTSHTEVIDEAVPAECSFKGLTEGKHCSVCNTVLVAQEEIPATGKHSWDISHYLYIQCSMCGMGGTPADLEYTGTCGDDAYWKIKNGVLTIYGSGAMYDNMDHDMSWRKHYTPIYDTVILPEIHTVNIESGITHIGNLAFAECTLKTLTIPDTVTSIGYEAFAHCEKLTDVVIPDSVHTIGGGAFISCPSITTIAIPDTVTVIEDCLFSGCTSLQSVTLGNKVERISSAAFSCCTNLTTITLPDSLTHIDECAFDGCAMLTSVTIPQRVEYIGERAFDSCDNLTAFLVDENNAYYSNDAFGVLYNKDATELIRIPSRFEGEYIIPKSVHRIAPFAIYCCDKITTVVIPESVTETGAALFYQCNNLEAAIYCGTAEQWSSIDCPEIFAGLQFHAYNEWNTEPAPSCTEEGLKQRKCSYCGHTDTEAIDALGHTPGNAVEENRVEPTCTTEGSYESVVYCTVCCAELSRETKILDKLGQGVIITGQVSFEGNSATTTIVKLMQNGTLIAQTEITGNMYSFSGVFTGIYDLVIERENHLPYTIAGVPVETADVDLTKHPVNAIANAVLVAGDINSDGCIDLQDVVLLTSSNTYSKPYDEAANKSADVNGDRHFDLQDLAIITSEKNYGKEAITVSFGEIAD